MNRFRRVCKALLYPHLAIRILLLPIATALLVYVFAVLDEESPVAIASYLLSFYALTVWCMKIPHAIAFARKLKRNNKYALRWSEDVRLRVNLTLYGTFLWNAAYAALQLGLGLRHNSAWYYSLAVYYIFLAVMRFFLVRHTRKHAPGEGMRAELMKYHICGWIFLAMNVTLSVMVFFMVYRGRTFHHNDITAIAMAAYTFTTFTTAIVNIVKYRKYNSPVFSASKAVSLVAASVSMLTLTSTMLTTFGKTEDKAMHQTSLIFCGGAVSVFITSMAIYMIVKSRRKLDYLKKEVKHEPT